MAYLYITFYFKANNKKELPDNTVETKIEYE
jgi:hypothetical protein